MSRSGLTPKQVERAAWRLLGALLSRIDRELFIGDLHPGGGQYDCLSLITKAPSPFLMLNRAGDSAEFNGTLIEDIWLKSVRDGIQETALHILQESKSEFAKNGTDKNKVLVLACKRMARWVNAQKSERVKPFCCWIDDQNYVGPAQSLINKVKIPQNWKSQKPPYESSDWSAWLFALTIDEEVIGVVNMMTGDAIDCDGLKIMEWYEPFPPIAIKKSNPNSKVVSMPTETPSEEVLKLFRRVATFNGYKVFGEGLAEMAQSVFENWDKNQDLPRDLDQIKGALFFEARKSHHTDQYPKGREFLYVKALAEAIDDLSS